MNHPQLPDVYHRLLTILATILNPGNPDPTVIGPDQSIMGDLGFTAGALDNLTKNINDEFFNTTGMSEPEVQAAATVMDLAEAICNKPAEK